MTRQLTRDGAARSMQLVPLTHTSGRCPAGTWTRLMLDSIAEAPDDTITTESLLMLCAIPQRTWRVTTLGRIRSEYDECPLCAVANEVWGTTEWSAAAMHAVEAMIDRSMEKNETRAVSNVMNAADDPAHPLRRDLLAALGIAEGAA